MLAALSLLCCTASAVGPASAGGMYFPSTCASRCNTAASFQQPVPAVPDPNKATRANQWSDLLLLLVSRV